MAHKGSVHQTPHKFKEKVKPTKTERGLQSEIKHLTKQVSRLRKELNKSNTLVENAIDPEPLLTPNPTINPNQCPKCKIADLKELNLGYKTYLICDNCKFRESVNT